MKLKNYYALLEVLPQASADEIKKAHRKLVKIWHPDKNKSNEAPETFQNIHEAYENLYCPAKRQVYNLKFWKVFGKPTTTSNKKPNKTWATKSFDGEVSGLEILRRNKERLFGKSSQKPQNSYEQWVDDEFVPQWLKKMQDAIKRNKSMKPAA